MVGFYGRRNQVYPVLFRGRGAVEKHFADIGDWQREKEAFTALSGGPLTPRLLSTRPGVLVTEYLPYPHFLDELERQEREGFDPAPWKSLVNWLLECHSRSGRLPSDCNLRNFLWDREGGRAVGLDLEGFEPGTPSECAADLAAYVLEYAPAHTQIKRQCARLLAAEAKVTSSMLETALTKLNRRRETIASATPVSGIILAGGQSRRMGRPKAELALEGKTLLEAQREKLRALGVEEIFISGPVGLAPAGARAVEDIFPNRGPLGGLHACLLAANNPSCLVLSVDVPLIPLQALYSLKRLHRGGITLLCRSGKLEPLIGVYDSSLAPEIELLIRDGGAPVRRLTDRHPPTLFDYAGPGEFLNNCNTPEDFEKIKHIARLYWESGLPLV